MNAVNEVRVTAIGIYSEIARENFQKLIKLESQRLAVEEKISKLEKEDEKLYIQHELDKFEIETGKYVAIVIVFSAITVEAYIYDYAARHLSDAFVKNYLDKLDPVSKWVIIPPLVTGKELSRKKRWFELLNKLIKQRNNIIHHKSSSLPIKLDEAIAFFKKAQVSSAQTYITAREAIELLDILPIEMQGIDLGETGWINSFAPKTDPKFNYTEEQ
jgi:hypothetical protein